MWRPTKRVPPMIRMRMPDNLADPPRSGICRASRTGWRSAALADLARDPPAGVGQVRDPRLGDDQVHARPGRVRSILAARERRAGAASADAASADAASAGA